MRVAVFSRVFKIEDLPHLQSLFDALIRYNTEIFVYQPYLDNLKQHFEDLGTMESYQDYQDLGSKNIDFFISLGGDGTILEAVTHIRGHQIPIIGINLGRLGFLAYIEKKNIAEAVQQIYSGDYELEERQLIRLISSTPIFGDLPFALNDFTIHKRDTSSMITIHTYLNGEYLNAYWADGIILATPTGSTGYSLSCGGPIVYPGSCNFVMTPIAPHNLSVRPIVISDDSVIEFKIEGRAENYLCTLDSRFETITAANPLTVKKNNFSVKLVQLKNKRFIDTMREKLTWGIDSRNH